MSEFSSYSRTGTLKVDDPTYVKRSADDEFYAGLKAGEFCYVLNSRQMGKSSLGVRTIARLQAEGTSCAFIDLSMIIEECITETTWYNGLIKILLNDFEINKDFNLKKWLEERNYLSSIQRFDEFIKTVVLAIPDRQFVIFLDEIDSIVRLGTIADNFFAYVRSCWNQRALKPEYQRLTFAVLGVATASDLMQDRQRTPFNIGQEIDLYGFQLNEVEPLSKELIAKSPDPDTLMQAVLEWTGGQPFLTQKVRKLILEAETFPAAGAEVAWVERLVKEQIINNWQAHDDTDHLKEIRRRLLFSEEKKGRLLGLYQQIWKHGEIRENDLPEEIDLCLTGLVVKRDGMVRIYNPIYAAVFNAEWVQQELANLRPYGGAITAWLASWKLDESRLLRGQALEDARRWAEGKNLQHEDYQFLNKSTELREQENERLVDIEKKEKEILEQEKRILEKAKNEADRREAKALELEKISKEQEQKALKSAKIAEQKRDRALLVLMICIPVALMLTIGSTIWTKIKIDESKESIDIANTATQLEKDGDSALRTFKKDRVRGLLKVLKSGNELQELIVRQAKIDGAQLTKGQLVLNQYPAVSPYGGLLHMVNTIQEGPLDKDIWSTSWSPDGQTLATGFENGTVKLRQRDGSTIASFSTNQGRVITISWSSDGQTLATGFENGTTHILHQYKEIK